MPDTDARALVLAALAKLAPPAEDGQVAMLPSARAGRTIDMLADAGDLDGLKSRRPDMRAVLESVLNWHVAKATKPTMKAAGRALTATREDGSSVYPQAVEVLSFVSACAPLLEPDRLARLIGAAASASSAYQPILYPARLADELLYVIGDYPEARRETLLASLWESAHDGRWWDHTAGLGRRRRRRNPDAGGPVTETPDGDVIEKLLAEELYFSPPTLEELKAAVPTVEQCRRLAALAHADHRDPDTPVLIAHVDALQPNERPSNPIETMVATLAFLRREAEASDKLAEFCPAKPKEWGELYPKASLVAFPYPDALMEALHWTKVGTAQFPVRCEVIRNANELFLNKEYMGNCTYGYKGACAQGTAMLLRMHAGGEVYNAALRRNGTVWTVGEVNSRHNAGNVPDPVRQAVGRAASLANAAA